MFAARNAMMTGAAKAGDSFYSNTKAILHFDSDFSDNSSLASSWTASGSVSVSSTQSKFGGKSLYVNGGYLYPSAASSNFAFGTGDFTVEMWVYMTSVSGFQTIFDTRPDSTGNYLCVLLQSGYPRVNINNSTLDLGTNVVVSTDIWTHVAVCKTGGYIKGYVNGTQQNSPLANSTNFLDPSGSSFVRIGTGINGFNKFTGYIDDVRITKGTARYTATFTPPTEAFPNNA